MHIDVMNNAVLLVEKCIELAMKRRVASSWTINDVDRYASMLLQAYEIMDKLECSEVPETIPTLRRMEKA